MKRSKDEGEQESRTYAPMYSTHGHERKTHIATDDRGSLCGIERRYPDLLWTIGATYYNVAEQFLIDDPDHPNACASCRQAYLKIEGKGGPCQR